MNDHDLLIQLIQKVDLFYEEFRRGSNGTGFPRCADRLARIEELEDDVKTLSTRLWWALTTAVVTGAGFIITIIKGGLNL